MKRSGAHTADVVKLHFRIWLDMQQILSRSSRDTKDRAEQSSDQASLLTFQRQSRYHAKPIMIWARDSSTLGLVVSSVSRHEKSGLMRV